MKLYSTQNAACEYVDWHNSYPSFWGPSKRRTDKKIDICHKYNISIRTLERYLKSHYVLNKNNHNYSLK